MKLTVKIPLFFGFLAAVGAIFFVSFWIYGIPALGMDGIYTHAYRQATHEVEAFADRERDAFEQRFLARRRELQLLSRNIALSATQANAAVPGGLDRAGLREQLQLQLRNLVDTTSGLYQIIYVYDPRSRKTIASTRSGQGNPADADAALLSEALQPGLTEFVTLGRNPEGDSVVVTFQILALDRRGFPTGEVLAIIVARMQPTSLLHADENAVMRALGNSGALMLLDPERRVIATTSDAVMRGELPRSISEEVAQGSDGVKVLRPADGGEFLLAFRLLHLGTTEGLALVTLRNTDDALHAIRTAFMRLSALGILLFALSMALMLFTARRLRSAENRLQDQGVHAHAVLENVVDGIITMREQGVILSANHAVERIFGYQVAQLVGSNFSLLLPPGSEHPAVLGLATAPPADGAAAQAREVMARRRNGQVFPMELVVTRIDQEGSPVLIARIADISERKQAEGRIEELAFFDQVTGLPNRTLLNDRLKQTRAASSRSGQHGALLFIDLDNFKALNDTLGHDFGDMLLKQAAQRLRTCVRDGDTVARFGGDEFVVVLAGLSPDAVSAAHAIETIAKKILTALRQPYQLGSGVHTSTASIGITLFKGDHEANDVLMKQADLAMYQSKETGRNTWHFFDPHMETSVKERVSLESDLRRAIEEQQFLLHYQAQITVDRITGAEVLVRWKHPQRGMVPPSDFIPLAEETGLIIALGRWVMDCACAQLVAWAGRPGMADLSIAVNVSAHQFHHPEFVQQVLETLHRTGANPRRLKLELTESALVTDVEDLIGKMHALKAEGVEFSLDDFGTGYSSLSILNRLPLDQLKIDQSFVRAFQKDSKDAAIIRTIIALAHNQGLGVIAEGVETGGQKQFLDSLGCQAYQGYHFSRPLPLAEFEALASKPLTVVA